MSWLEEQRSPLSPLLNAHLVTPGSAAEIDGIFNALDTDSDGTVSYDELFRLFRDFVKDPYAGFVSEQTLREKKGEAYTLLDDLFVHDMVIAVLEGVRDVVGFDVVRPKYPLQRRCHHAVIGA